MAGLVEDASWAVKKANALKIETQRGVKVLFLWTESAASCSFATAPMADHSPRFCSSARVRWSTSTGLMQYITQPQSPLLQNIAVREYPIPPSFLVSGLTAPMSFVIRLSGGWLQHLEGSVWVRRWFVIRDSFLLCCALPNSLMQFCSCILSPAFPTRDKSWIADNNREDVMPATTTGKPVNRRFVLPLGGVIVAYHKTVKQFSFSLQIYSGGELKHEFIFAADSEPIMNVWMEVLYVSTGKELPGYETENQRAALEVTPHQHLHSPTQPTSCFPLHVDSVTYPLNAIFTPSPDH
jgi:hypothetical protein